MYSGPNMLFRYGFIITTYSALALCVIGIITSRIKTKDYLCQVIFLQQNLTFLRSLMQVPNRPGFVKMPPGALCMAASNGTSAQHYSWRFKRANWPFDLLAHITNTRPGTWNPKQANQPRNAKGKNRDRFRLLTKTGRFRALMLTRSKGVRRTVAGPVDQGQPGNNIIRQQQEFPIFRSRNKNELRLPSDPPLDAPTVELSWSPVPSALKHYQSTLGSFRRSRLAVRKRGPRHFTSPWRAARTIPVCRGNATPLG